MFNVSIIVIIIVMAMPVSISLHCAVVVIVGTVPLMSQTCCCVVTRCNDNVTGYMVLRGRKVIDCVLLFVSHFICIIYHTCLHAYVCTTCTHTHTHTHAHTHTHTHTHSHSHSLSHIHTRTHTHTHTHTHACMHAYILSAYCIMVVIKF